MRFIFVLVIILFSQAANANLVQYSFDIENGTVNYTGTPAKSITIGGKIPGPTIEATVGDVLRVTFHNKMDVETSIHWHGVLLPNSQDGVPYLTTPPIKAGKSFTYEYKIKRSGTYWYHSHTGLQEQQGMYGSLVFHPQHEVKNYDRDYVVVFSDWINESPDKVLSNLKMDGDYYALKKDSVQSWYKVLTHGWPAIKKHLQGSWIRMGSMDVSDVGYDAFLANGKKQETLQAKKSEKIKLRLINAATSSYFNVEFAGGPMTIIAADGVDVEPVDVKRLSIAVAETYDIIVSVPDSKAYELRATSQDGTGYSSTIIGNGNLVQAAIIPPPNPFLVNHETYSKQNKHNNKASQSHMMHMNNASMNMHSNEYHQLRSIRKTTLPTQNPVRKIVLNLTGNMERYSWHFNNKTLSETEKILITKGENVQFILNNTTMMNHPLHLHGHFFRVLNGQGDYSPLKHTLNIPAMSKVIIEFEANEDKDWFFHCHTLYHMKTGMARVVSYGKERYPSYDVLSNLTRDSEWYFAGDTSVLSNMFIGDFRLSNTRNTFEIESDYNYKKKYDIDFLYKLNITRFIDLYTGVSFERDDPNKKSENTAVFGMHYMLPMLIESDFRIDSEGHTRLELGSNLQLTKRSQFAWYWNTDKEYRLSLNYETTKNMLLSLVYDSDFQLGVGARIKF